MYANQHGSLEHTSCQTNVVLFLDEFASLIDKGIDIVGLSKTFGLVPCDILIEVISTEVAKYCLNAGLRLPTDSLCPSRTSG